MKNYKRIIQIRKVRKIEVLPALLFLMLMILGSISYSLATHISQEETIRNAAVAAVIAAVFGGYLLFRREETKYKPYIFTVLSVASACSFLGLMYFDTARFPIWVLGSMLTARFMKGSFAILYTYGMLILSLFYDQPSFLQMLTFILAGTIHSYISVYLKKASSVIYVCLISVSMQVSILFINNEFVVEDILLTDVLLSVGCLAGSVFFVYASGKVFDTVIKKKEGDIRELAEWLMLNKAQDKMIYHKREKSEEKEETSMQKILEEDYPLMQRLKKQAPRLYRHSESVANLAMKAAAFIGANQELCYAGGWYHEMGRLLPDSVDPIKEICSEYSLPSSVVNLVRQQNYKEHMPDSVEAVIVLVSDQIISTQNYLKALKEKRISMEQIIENAFNSQLKRGAFDKAGITVAQYNKLKQFYMIELM